MTDGRTDLQTDEHTDGHADKRTNPYCIVIKNFIYSYTICFWLMQYPVFAKYPESRGYLVSSQLCI